MKRRMLSLIAVLCVVALAVAACEKKSSNLAPQSTPELKAAVGSGKKTVVFFLNPEGGPCQAQDAILKKLHSETGGAFNLVYVSVAHQDHTQAFYDYGIRSLPSLVLLNGKGEIARYFPPGIQSYETLTETIGGLN